jgi:hypothetical protein
MGFSQENGYIPAEIDDLMNIVMGNYNTQFGTTYTTETFLGTNAYKYFYGLIQKLQENDVKTSEIFLKLQQYFIITNEMISRPVVTGPGLIDALKDAGFIASVKPPLDADAGKIYICVDLDAAGPTYAAQVLSVANIIKDSVAAGVITQGAVVTNITLTNGQAFDFKFALPNFIDVKLRLTITTSDNNQVVILDPDTVKANLVANINAKYSLGKDFEPQKYFTTVDAPWASQVLLEWSSDGGSTYFSTIYDADFDDLFVYPLADIELVED